MAATKKKTTQEVMQEKSERMMNGIALWTAFYRNNPQRFCKDYLNVHLKLFQKIILYAMMHNYYFIYIAARGQNLIINNLPERTLEDNYLPPLFLFYKKGGVTYEKTI